MTRSEDESEWPPSEGKEFIRSANFGTELIRLTHEYERKYPAMDFTDAAARVFAWFDGKLGRNRHFINSRRFPTRNAFRAYLKSAIWNAALMAKRDRQRFVGIDALPIDRPIASVWGADPEDRLSLRELVERLPEPHRTVFEHYCIDESPPSDLARTLGRPEEEIVRIYEEAVDLLAEIVFG
jgi:hypothetical protein